MNRKTFERFEFFGHRRIDRLMIGGMKHLQTKKNEQNFLPKRVFFKTDFERPLSVAADGFPLTNHSTIEYLLSTHHHRFISARIDGVNAGHCLFFF